MLWELLYKEKREIDIHASESVRATCQASEQSHSNWKGQSSSILQYPPKTFGSVLIPDCTDYGRGSRRMGACLSAQEGEAVLVSAGLGQGYSDRSRGAISKGLWVMWV